VSVEDDKHSGRPSTSKTTENVEIIWELAHEDHRRTIHELQTLLGCYGVCQEIFTENLNRRHIAMKFVPQLLTNDQRQQCVNVCLELWEKANKDPTFISRIITGVETWFVSQIENETEGMTFWNSVWHLTGITSGTRQH
jgi:hypothetical protein